MQPMTHGYFKMGNVSCRIISDTLLFMCKICVPAISTACPRHNMLYLGIIWCSTTAATNT